VIVSGVRWLVPDEPRAGDRALVRVRHRATLARAEFVRVDGDEVEFALDEPIAAITAGQSLVAYTDSGRVLGGGFIASNTPAVRRRELPVAAR
jgi:tRNA-specific 2-thiouridylase